ncbi:hypothetical protein A0H81_08782 [Grifola frondosa]|uniref:Uncharacterized protein n=1 Tax=Grifola frondosa TaxID=5627 RepID=A0A1C7M4M5_GRIFR|nr:hypothetical protein A0H81_08782 [Grifola frondosa]
MIYPMVIPTGTGQLGSREIDPAICKDQHNKVQAICRAIGRGQSISVTISDNSTAEDPIVHIDHCEHEFTIHPRETWRVNSHAKRTLRKVCMLLVPAHVAAPMKMVIFPFPTAFERTVEGEYIKSDPQRFSDNIRQNFAQRDPLSSLIAMTEFHNHATGRAIADNITG